MFENKTRLWVVHISSEVDAMRRDVALRAQEEGFVCIGWTDIGNLAPYDTRDKMKAAYRKAYPKASDGSVRASYGQVFRFAHEMQIGDPIVYPIKGSRDILIGEITGAYQWADKDSELVAANSCNVRKVKWLKRVPRIVFTQDALHSFGGFSSVASSDDYLEDVIAVLKNEKGAAAPDKPTAAKGDSLDKSDEDQRINFADQAEEETEDHLLRLWSRTAQKFEHVVAAVFRAMKYTAQVQAGTHDLGVDVVAHPDPLGVHPPLLKIQVKSGTSRIGAKDVKELRGLLNQGEKGVLVALGGFTNDANHVQQNDADLVLIDGARFVQLFLDHYELLAPEVRHEFPLRRVYVNAG